MRGEAAFLLLLVLTWTVLAAASTAAEELAIPTGEIRAPAGVWRPEVMT